MAKISATVHVMNYVQVVAGPGVGDRAAAGPRPVPRGAGNIRPSLPSL